MHVMCPYYGFWACFDLIAFIDKDELSCLFPKIDNNSLRL
jgi:hypothetical protein